MLETLLLLVGGLLALLSFAGLCAEIRVRFDVHCCVAPLTAAGCIIVALTLAGMLDVLEPTCYVLYSLGLVCLAHSWLLKKSTPPHC